MTLKSQIADDVASVFFNTDDFAETATLIRKSQETSDLPVIVDQEELASKSLQGISVSRVHSVLLIRAAAYLVSGVARQPENIDKFTIGTRSYQCFTPEGKKRCWEYSGPDSLVYKIYVQEL